MGIGFEADRSKTQFRPRERGDPYAVKTEVKKDGR
jgi:hypothetical protein